MESTPFTYEALSRSDQEIRLLEIRPGENATPLCCRLLTLRLPHTLPSYAAISYHWGNQPDAQQPARTIWIDGRSMSVRENCYYALHQVRLHLLRLHNEGLRYIWIDSVCINQGDLQEKAAQVQIMASHIYAKADRVFVSLGPASPLINDFVQALNTWESLDLRDPSGTYQDIKTDKVLEGFLALGNLPYWRRLWILPEIVSARALHILCGPYLTTWSRLQSLLDHVRVSALSESASQQFEKIWASPLGLVYRTKDTVNPPLMGFELNKILTAHSNWLCTDPRDRYFAFSSILFHSSENNLPYIKVDYGISALELAQQVLHRLICDDFSSQSLDRLCSSMRNLLNIFSVKPSDLSVFAAFAVGQNRVNSFLQSERWKAPIRANLRGQTITPIITNSDGNLAVTESCWNTQMHSKENVRPQGWNFCLPLFGGSTILGWLCQDARSGDFLLRFVVEDWRMYLVLRPLGNPERTRAFKLVGQATIASLFEITSDMPSFGRGDHSYCDIAMRDLIALVTPVVLFRISEGYSDEHQDQDTEMVLPAQGYSVSMSPPRIFFEGKKIYGLWESS